MRHLPTIAMQVLLHNTISQNLAMYLNALGFIADTYLDGKVGLAYDSTAFKGNWSGTEYLHRSNSLFEYGFIENFDENLANTELHLQRLR